MRSMRRLVTAVAAIAVALMLAAPAHAGPDCSDVGPNTRMCTRSPGHTAITTSPDPALTNPYPGWGFGGLGLGIAGRGIWIGF
jgi:hypothetical protein